MAYGPLNDYSIDRRQLLVELAANEQLLAREARAILKNEFFDPAVKKLNQEFNQSLITQEIEAGPFGTNISDTLEAPFEDPPATQNGRDPGDYTPQNLVNFMGLKHYREAITEIRKRLDPNHADGPALVYRNMDKNHLAFRFEARSPDEESIYNHTPFDSWAPGISWAKRIEQGISGIGYFLNALHRKGSRTGTGIQVDQKLRTGRFKPTSYLSKLFNDFLRRVSSGREPLA